MLELCTLASGSSGNSLLVTDGATHILVDAGISCRRICTALQALGVAPGELSGVLVTHEHTDHVSGLATLTKRFPVPIYTTAGTARALCRRTPQLEGRIHTIRPGGHLELGTLGVESFPTPHDTCESVGYAVSSGGRKAAVVTDLGHVTDEVMAAVSGAQLVVAEANHDEEWVRSGPYPYFLKARILGERGHLSNEAGADLACRAVCAGARTLVLAHLSAENNTPQRAYDTVEARLVHMGAHIGGDVLLEVAPRASLGRRYCV